MSPAPRIDPVPPALNPRFLDRVRQVQWDHYYIEIARTVAKRANCTGSRVGAVLVAENRIIATGFNGTPAGFPNCLEGGCLRCRDRALYKAGRKKEMADKRLAKGPKQLDICICVHAEANAPAVGGARWNADGLQRALHHTQAVLRMPEGGDSGRRTTGRLPKRLHRERSSLLRGAVRTSGRASQKQRCAQLRAALPTAGCAEGDQSTSSAAGPRSRNPNNGRDLRWRSLVAATP